MDIELQTGTRNPSLRLENVGLFADGNDFRLEIVVVSDWIMARRVQFLPRSSFDRLLRELKNLDRWLVGRARLEGEYELRETFIEVEAFSHGHVRVCGALVGDVGTTQEVKFAFVTDQTCLRPLIGDIEALLRLPPGYGTT